MKPPRSRRASALLKLQYDPILRGLKHGNCLVVPIALLLLLQYDPILRGLKLNLDSCDKTLLFLLQYDPILRGLKPRAYFFSYALAAITIWPDSKGIETKNIGESSSLPISFITIWPDSKGIETLMLIKRI